MDRLDEIRAFAAVADARSFTQGGRLMLAGKDPFPSYASSACTLLRWSPQGHPLVPHVARAWTVDAAEREFTFHLRRGMRWSDGVPFTSADLAWWWETEATSTESGGVDLPSLIARVRQPFTWRGLSSPSIPRPCAFGIGLPRRPEHAARLHKWLHKCWSRAASLRRIVPAKEHGGNHP